MMSSGIPITSGSTANTPSNARSAGAANATYSSSSSVVQSSSVSETLGKVNSSTSTSTLSTGTSVSGNSVIYNGNDGNVVPQQQPHLTDDSNKKILSQQQPQQQDDGGQFNPAPPVAPFRKAERPASEIFFANAQHPLPEADQVDKWFESLSQFEDMLEDMAKVSLDPVFKDELNAIDQWFSVLSEPERTAALYSLMQHCSDLQIRFFITILQQMLKMDNPSALQGDGEAAADAPYVERHSVAVQSGAYISGNNKSHQQQVDPRFARMSYDGPLGSGSYTNGTPNATSGNGSNGVGGGSPPGGNVPLPYNPNAAGQQAKQQQGGAGNSWNMGNVSADNLLLGNSSSKVPGNADAHAIAAAAKWGLVGGSSHAATGSASSLASIGAGIPAAVGDAAASSRRSGVFVERPKSSTDADANPDWRVNRQSAASSIGGADQAVSAAAAALAAASVASSAAGSRQPSMYVQQQVGARGSLVDMEPKDFRWSSLTESMEPFGSLGPDPNAGTLTQMLDSRMSINGGGSMGQTARGSIAARRSINNRLSIAVKSPRDTMQMASPVGAAGNGELQASLAQMVSPSAASSGAIYRSQGGGGGVLYAPASRVGHHHVATPRMAQATAAPITPAQAALNASGGASSGVPSSAALSSAGSSPSRANFSRGYSAHHQAMPQSPAGPKPQDVVDFELLKDIPAWLRSLRLHKYTECFNGMVWQDIVKLNDEQLQAKGVAALGARRKMLKVFDNIQIKMVKVE